MENGQIIEFRDSRLMCYHSPLKVVAGSVPCSATSITRPDFALVFFCLLEAPTLAGLAGFVRMSAAAQKHGIWRFLPSLRSLFSVSANVTFARPLVFMRVPDREYEQKLGSRRRLVLKPVARRTRSFPAACPNPEAARRAKTDASTPFAARFHVVLHPQYPVPTKRGAMSR